MHMWMWFGYDLGEFLFSGLEISTRWAFALTWIALFIVSLLFEGSKVYLARVQREAVKKLYPYRSDERRNLLCDNSREAGSMMEPTTSRNTNPGQMTRWASIRVRILVNLHQSSVFVLHNAVGYLLMLAVMVYNVHLLLAVVLGMTLGYFLFGPKLTQMQMECFGRKKVIICTPECDDTAETSTPPLLGSSTESDFFICQTRSCIQPSHYFSAGSSTGAGDATCHYGAKKCPSKVARARKLQATGCRSDQNSARTEDAHLLRTEHQGCCKKKQESQEICSSTASRDDEPAPCCSSADDAEAANREDSPQISCCHHAKTTSAVSSSESQEQIVK